VSQADFDAQFRLAKQIEQARVRARRMLEEAADLKIGLVKMNGRADAAALGAQLNAFVGESAPIGGSNAPTTLTAISDWLDKLASAVDGGDGAPTPDDVHGFAVVSGALDQIETRWRAFAASARARIPAGQ
jgi:hypothetical protein